MLSRASGMVRDVTMAAAFGAHPAVAAFLMAFRFANLPRRLLGEGAMQSAMIPHFEKLRGEDPARAGHFFRDLTLFLTVLLSTLVLVAEGVLSFFHGEVVHLTMLMLPALLFICLYGLNSSLLNCEGGYFLPGVAPAAFNGVWIVGTLLLCSLPAVDAMPKLALVIVFACAAQWGVTLPGVWRLLRGGNGRLWSPEVKALMRPLLLGMLGVGATQINSALDPIFARIADPSGPAYLWFALRFQQLPLALFGIAISGALLPPLSRAVAAGDWERYRAFLRYCRRRAVALMVACTLGIWLFGGWAVNLLFEHGRFSITDAAATTHCLWAYSFGLVPMALVLIHSSAFFAHGDTRTPAVASALAVAFNVGFNALFVLGFGWGSISVAIATSMASWLQLVVIRKMSRAYE